MSTIQSADNASQPTFKSLKKKEEQNFYFPSREVLETFPSPGVNEITFTCNEVTSLCPITGQPDYSVVEIKYTPKDLCLESKSLKLYMGGFRQFGCFAEQMARRVWNDLWLTLKPETLIVTVLFNSRGGIDMEARVWNL